MGLAQTFIESELKLIGYGTEFCQSLRMHALISHTNVVKNASFSLYHVGDTVC